MAIWAASLAVFAQPGMMGRGWMGHGMMGMSMERHRLLMMYGLPPQYAAKANPLAGNEQAVKRGKQLFEQHCSRCHGMGGLGDGPDGSSLDPRPANVAAASKMPMASDGYLFWTISEGGAPVGSAMPPFKRTLSEDEIWRIVTYLRVL